MTKPLFTEAELDECRQIVAAQLRAKMRGPAFECVAICAANALKSFAALHGMAKVEAIARELDARAPSGDYSKPLAPDARHDAKSPPP